MTLPHLHRMTWQAELCHATVLRNLNQTHQRLHASHHHALQVSGRAFREEGFMTHTAQWVNRQA